MKPTKLILLGIAALALLILPRYRRSAPIKDDTSIDKKSKQPTDQESDFGNQST